MLDYIIQLIKTYQLKLKVISYPYNQSSNIPNIYPCIFHNFGQLFQLDNGPHKYHSYNQCLDVRMGHVL